MLGSRTTNVVSKRSKDREQNGRAAGMMWFVVDAILIYAHVIIMNIIIKPHNHNISVNSLIE